ncbi:MAG: histidine--tRNA ligase [Oscillospiraceae bacterium]|nr:histidine--tRNA ligase [Oscillospiraceae bacterium]
MKEKIRAQRGTKDILPNEEYKWNFLKKVFESTAKSYNFKIIKTPVFEATELFNRSVGETTDIVQKEMYTFKDKGGRSLTLRPEGTAGVVRAILEHGLCNFMLPLKVYYLDTFYRYEKPQSGRYREFFQFGCELFGSNLSEADAEVMHFAFKILDELSLANYIELKVNSVGCSRCKKKYFHALHEYFELKKSALCQMCLERLQKNPARILDCKSQQCENISLNAPITLDYLCNECYQHFESVKDKLKNLKLKYTVDPKIVRGLDYYTRTVFELVDNSLGAQKTVCGGGRYDNLVKEMGGRDLPALGFGLGVNRLLLALENHNIKIKKDDNLDLYIINVQEDLRSCAVVFCRVLRENFISCECDLLGRSLKAQLKYADRICARFVLVLGSEELEKKEADLKNLKTREIKKISLKKYEFATQIIKILK